jgi:Mg2+-importing ATPase
LWLPWSPLAPALGLTVPPHAYWWGLGGILAAYAVVTQGAKAWLTRHFGID